MGCYKAPRPPAPQEVIGRAIGLASNECIYLYGYGSFPGIFAFSGIGVIVKSLCESTLSALSILMLPSLLEIFLWEAKLSGALLTTFKNDIFYSSSTLGSFLCLLSQWFFN